jgi:hypothetical protein
MMNARLILTMLVAAFMTAVLASPALAQTQLLTDNYGRFYSLPADPSTYFCDNANGVNCEGSVLAPGTNWTVNYLSRSVAGFGVLHAYASLNLSGDGSLGPLDGGAVPFPNFVSIGGRAGFRDQFIVGGSTGSGTMRFTFRVTGLSTQAFGAIARPSFQYVPIVGGREDWDHAVQYAVTPDGIGIVLVPIAFNQPVPIEIWFYALAQIFTPSGWTTGSAATADYFDTAVLSSITVSDSGGHVVPAFTISSASGTNYDAAGVFTGVGIRVKPGDIIPSINPKSNGQIAVAILSTHDFSAPGDVNRSSLTFGASGFEQSLTGCNAETVDINFDGLPDLLCRFSTELTGFSPADQAAQLRGRTNSGMPIRGSDAVRVVR